MEAQNSAKRNPTIAMSRGRASPVFYRKSDLERTARV